MENANISPQSRTKVVSIFKPHHTTQILYPSRLLLKDGELQTMTAPRHMAQRYEPHPIVPDAAVIFNKTSNNQAVDTDFTSLTAISLWPDDEFVSTGNIFKDMEVVA
ncbi:hypothetical protein DOTSEDRAFT_32735 [Dothistroma septosporum NZE10]|uniref:Uncharacterized protein n=1 Tax=Dothistroma septosporum (strain NZE10 / CBS 128990) TaxID=675120 RepID=N1PUK6_DOTSN|nr:hypothetical protein DOTSEDRAFT_32735 [Dothistroma septosporum NZE10]